MFHGLTPESLDRFRRVYAQLAVDTPYSVLLDSCGWAAPTGGFYMMGCDARQVVQLKARELWVDGQCHGRVDSAGALWDKLAALFPEVPVADGADDLPFVDGWVGVLGYELNHLLEPTVPERHGDTAMGELYLVRFAHRVVWLPAADKLMVLSDDGAWRRRFETLLAAPLSDTLPYPSGHGDRDLNIQASLSPEAYEAGAKRLLTAIEAGEVYQANLSVRFSVDDVPASTVMPLYQHLAALNPSPFSGVFQTPHGVVIANSPERLVKLNVETGVLETRPIAGTRGRGQTPAETVRIAETLKTDVKEQAEHMMLVDLERNDLGRVSLPGTVHVPELGVLEQYSHVTHLVSQVEGRWDPAKSRWQVLSALFPGGTITGCPKVRCMQLLAQTEPVARGLYTGSLGYLDSRGHLDFNILIRSLFYWPQGRLDFHAGAGIVADSQPAWEYRECLRKAEAIKGVLRHVVIDTCQPPNGSVVSGRD